MTIGPDVLTLPEIAQKLSIDGHKVTCAPALQQFAAYVYLKDRSWNKARTLLEQGLQVQFLAPNKDKPNELILEWNTDMRRRERSWFTRYADGLHQYLQAQVGTIANYVALPAETLQQQRAVVKAQMQALEGNKQTGTPGYMQMSAKDSYIEQALQIGGSADARLGFAWAQSNLLSISDAVNILRVGSATQVQNVGQIDPGLIAPVLASHPQAVSDMKWQYATGGWRLQYIAGQANLEINTRLLARDGSITPLLHMYLPLPQSVQDVYEGMYVGEQRFAGLGKPAIQWLREEQRKTKMAIGDVPLLARVSSQVGEDSGDISRLLERWSKDGNSEAMMVLWPQREWARLNIPDKKTLGELVGTADAWALHTYDGVLCLQNLMSFVDREQALPTAALVQYARVHPAQDVPSVQMANQASPRNVADYDLLRAYCRGATASTVHFWTYPFQILSYRGTPTIALDRSVGVMLAWEHLTDTERNQLLQRAQQVDGKAGEYANFPLGRVDGRTRDQLVSLLRGWGNEYPSAFLPEFPAALGTCSLNIRMIPRAGGNPFTLRMEVQPPADSQFLVWGCQANTTWLP